MVLAECSFDEANLILQQIRDDYIACQVFFELSRDDLREHLGPPDLHRSPIAHILSHTRLSNPKHFSIYLNRINEAFQAVRQDSSAVLFASDRAGGLYVHNTTRRNIKALWQALVTSRMPSSSEIPGMAMPVGPAVPLTARPLPEAG